MTESMEAKTRKLLLAIELTAIAVAAILILIDYKLKRDLLELFARIENAIETGNRIYGTNNDNHPGDPVVHHGAVVGNNPTMETPNVPYTGNGHSPNGQRPNRRPTAKRNGGTGNTTVPDTDKPVGS